MKIHVGITFMANCWRLSSCSEELRFFALSPSQGSSTCKAGISGSSSVWKVESVKSDGPFQHPGSKWKWKNQHN